MKYTRDQINLAYLTGVFNVSGIDGLKTELDRLRNIKKEPCDIFSFPTQFEDMPEEFNEIVNDNFWDLL